MPSSVPVIDLTPWFSGDEAARAAVAAEVDGALRSVGFFLVTGHGVADEMRAQVRAEARKFFALPRDIKQRYAVTVAGRGWLPPGVEANAYAEGTETPPDLKESFAVGADQPTGDPEVDGYWFQPNVYPADVPGLKPPSSRTWPACASSRTNCSYSARPRSAWSVISSPGTPVTRRTR